MEHASLTFRHKASNFVNLTSVSPLPEIDTISDKGQEARARTIAWLSKVTTILQTMHISNWLGHDLGCEHLRHTRARDLRLL